jgi:hypothetical protein
VGLQPLGSLTACQGVAVCAAAAAHHALPEEALALVNAHAECAVDRQTLPLRTKVTTLLIQRMACTHNTQTHTQTIVTVNSIVSVVDTLKLSYTPHVNISICLLLQIAKSR